MKHIKLIKLSPFWALRYRVWNRTPGAWTYGGYDFLERPKRYRWLTELYISRLKAEKRKRRLEWQFKRRRMPASFIDKFIEFTKESETPTSFWKWGGYAIVAAAMRDNVFWMQRGHKKCPNIYVLLNADSAIHRKSGPIDEAARLLSAIAVTKVIRGRGSIQAIIEDLGSSAMDRETGKTLRGGSCLLVADELKSFFVGDDALIGIMTDLYEYKDQFDYKLRGSPIKVKNLCVSMLAASNDEFLKSVYTQEAVYGGLLGRTFLVKADEYRPGNSLLELEGEEEENKVKYDPNDLLNHLKEISKLNGRVRFNMDAKQHYDDWYLGLRKSYEKKPDRTGVLARMHTGVIKLAVILAVSRRTELIVRKADMEDAISDCLAILPNYDGFAMQVGKSNEAVAGTHLMNEMWLNGGQISKAAFLQKYWYEVSAETLEKLLVTLGEAGFVQIDTSLNGAVLCMTPKCREVFAKSETVQ